MRLRGISREFVEEAIRKPNQIVNSRFGRKIALRHYQYRTLKIIFEENEEIVVITAYWTRRG